MSQFQIILQGSVEEPFIHVANKKKFIFQYQSELLNQKHLLVAHH